jgi:ribosomal protein S18 acetylase RimI-like enzyme
VAQVCRAHSRARCYLISLLCMSTPAAALEIRTLRANELPAVHDLVLDAFSEYPVPMQPTRAQFESMLTRRGADWTVSFGAFHEDQLIGAAMTAIDDWPALHTGAYAVITAVRRGWQGRGVLTALFEWLSLALDRRGVTQMQLEVLIDNPRARRAYERLGFDSERHLFCFELPRLDRPQRFREQLGFNVYEGPSAITAQERHGSSWASFWSLAPAWTSSTGTVRRTENRVVFEATWEDELVGYAVVEPSSGELLQIAVNPLHRRRGIGTELIRACQERADRPTLRVLNVDDSGDRGVTIAFLRQLGATMTAVQLELVAHRIG